MFELIKQPWPWYIAGVIIGLTVPMLLLLGNKAFGISSSLRHICAACLPAKLPYFNYNWKKESWNLFFVIGIIIGASLASIFLRSSEPLQINEITKGILEAQNISRFETALPTDIFNWENLLTIKGTVFILIGGFLVGFGTRYAGGCTSGHSIMGLSNLQWPSLIATFCFMAGGFICTWFIIPYILKI